MIGPEKNNPEKDFIMIISISWLGMNSECCFNPCINHPRSILHLILS